MLMMISWYNDPDHLGIRKVEFLESIMYDQAGKCRAAAISSWWKGLARSTVYHNCNLQIGGF